MMKLSLPSMKAALDLQKLSEMRLVRLGLFALMMVLLWVVISNFAATKPKHYVRFDAKPAKLERGKWTWFEKTTRAPSQNKRVTARAAINAELMGFIYSAEGQVAIIRMDGKGDKIYKVGDNLAANVYVKHILFDQVVLNEYGKERVLLLQFKNLLENTKSKAKIKSAASQKTLQIAAKLPKGLDQFADIVSVIPVQTPAGSKGIKLQGAHSDLLNISELSIDDVVVNIEGQSVFEVINNPRSVNELIGKGSATVEVMRQGKVEYIDVDIGQLATRVLPLLGNRSLR